MPVQCNPASVGTVKVENIEENIEDHEKGAHDIADAPAE